MLLPKAVCLDTNSRLMKLVECNIIIEHVLDCEMFYESGYKMNETWYAFDAFTCFDSSLELI